MQLDFISARGVVLPLVNNDYFYLTNFDSQTAFTAALSSAVVGGVDGDSVNNVQANARDIVIDLLINPNKDVEEAKREILKTVKPKQRASLVWTQNERTVTINGVVSGIDMPRWNNGVTMQISLHCEQPFWEDIESVIQTISEAINLHYFTEGVGDMLYFPVAGIPLGEYDTIRTKTFTNNGDVSVGIEITIMAIDTVTNPIIYAADGSFFGVGYGTGAKRLVLSPGDSVVISTVKGHKSVTIDGVNILDKVKPNSKWLQLEAGENTFSINAEEASVTNMYFNLNYKQRYV